MPRKARIYAPGALHHVIVKLNAGRFCDLIAEEEFGQKYDLKAKGYDFDRVTRRVAEVLDIEIEQVTSFGKSPRTVKARSLLMFVIYWFYLSGKPGC